MMAARIVLSVVAMLLSATLAHAADRPSGPAPEATPWDSAMPEWKLNLTEEERWKIILAEYDLVQKTPRIPESK